MKRVIVSAVALMLAAPLVMAPASAQPGQDRRGQQSQQQDQDRDGRYRDQRGDARYQDGSVRRDRRQNWRDTRRDARWNDAEHNGYYHNNMWHYGPPPARLQNRRGVTLGYHPWQRGQRLGYYNNRYSEVDYRQHDLRRPPRGYRWVRNDGGDFLLAAVVSGLIAQVIINNGNDNRYGGRR